MKRLHRGDLFCWSKFHEPLELDFNSVLWVRPEGNVVIDPLPLSAHDAEHLATLGGVRHVVLTNSMHVRAAADLSEVTRWGPAAEREGFPLPCQRWVADGDELFPGLIAYELQGSKTPGELALVLDETTLITGDLVRAHRANTLSLLKPEQKLTDRGAALASVRRVLERHPRLEHVLVGDGWHAFSNGRALLEGLLSAGA